MCPGLKCCRKLLHGVRTGFLPIAGSLGDRLSKTRVFIAGMVVFMLTSLGCALAVNVPMLIAFRALQARGGAGLSTRNSPTAMRFVRAEHSGRSCARLRLATVRLKKRVD